MRLIALLFVSLILTGCIIVDTTQEISKTVWGSSTRALEKARSSAVVKTYDYSYWDVFRKMLEVASANGYVIFKKDEVNGYIVLLGIKGSVNTTEVGVFFVELNEKQTRVEISSLSTNAKRIASKQIFYDLDVAFGLIAKDKP